MLENTKNGFVNTLDAYSILGIVGKGTYGEVYKAVHISTGKVVALKKICYTDIGIPKSSTREIRLFSALKHPAIVKLREVVVENVEKGSRELSNQFYLVFDFVDNDLAGIVRAINKGFLPRLSSEVLKSYIYQIVQVLDFLHGNSIIHRDIKLDNFLVTNTHEIKLCDFGLSRQVFPSTHRLSHPVYAVAYRSPEILLDIQPYTTASDIWALGVLISSLLLGRTPFVGNNDRDLMTDILSKCGVIPANVRSYLKANNYSIPQPGMRCIKELFTDCVCVNFTSESDKTSLLDLCDRLLDMNPSMRPTTQMILNHPFLKDVLPTSRLQPLDKMKYCQQPLLNMVMRKL
ncbi:CRK7 protein kinase [Blastocystis sp. subtype 4]|uniref:CRK7 protein kinase n=1 Tax=Blastocystis sp. subtype 4 TaxID=944170 RepID=UPI00071137CC|nr:CRK7 protein kinase [Blastocystis sp. subtype 4]KNB41642.1 CRK7 protein kinase [Blastocystis sp. subtype 4]|eukprot:XP_014525085.1 CRK7 protein kinase [Blastocystis sp. subtype 4]